MPQGAAGGPVGVTFSISDMVRGKCVFLTVEDIVKAITETKNFIEEENTRRP